MLNRIKTTRCYKKYFRGDVLNLIEKKPQGEERNKEIKDAKDGYKDSVYFDPAKFCKFYHQIVSSNCIFILFVSTLGFIESDSL